MRSSLAVVLCLVAMLAFTESHAQKPTKTITGTVKRAEVYKGKIRAVYIEAPGEGDFLVARGTDVSKELVKHIGATVKAEGYVKKSLRDPGFALVIDILSYELDPQEEPQAVVQP